jgi:hypothetical protein
MARMNQDGWDDETALDHAYAEGRGEAFDEIKALESQLAAANATIAELKRRVDELEAFTRCSLDLAKADDDFWGTHGLTKREAGRAMSRFFRARERHAKHARKLAERRKAQDIGEAGE